MSIRKLLTIGAASAVLLGLAGPALAGEFKPISAEAFQQATTQGREFVIHVRTPNGARCRAQHAVLEKLMLEPRFANLLVLEIEFLSQPNAVALTGAKTPAVLIFHRGETEVGRLTAVTEEAPIRELLTKPGA